MVNLFTQQTTYPQLSDGDLLDLSLREQGSDIIFSEIFSRYEINGLPQYLLAMSEYKGNVVYIDGTEIITSVLPELDNELIKAVVKKMKFFLFDVFRFDVTTGEKEPVANRARYIDPSKVKNGEEAIIASALSLNHSKTQGESLEYLAYKILAEEQPSAELNSRVYSLALSAQQHGCKSDSAEGLIQVIKEEVDESLQG